MPTFDKRDDVLWIKHLRGIGINVVLGTAVRFLVNGIEIEFAPMKSSGGNPTLGLKAIGPNRDAWNKIAKGDTVLIELLASTAAASAEATRSVAASPLVNDANGPFPAGQDVRMALPVVAGFVPGPLPDSGAVGGFDVGYSDNPTTGLCILAWTRTTARWELRNATQSEANRKAKLGEISPTERRVAAVAIDGPLAPRLALSYAYRAADAILSHGALQKRGKPGQTNAGSGPALHREATRLANFALAELQIGPATHRAKIHPQAVVEAFPNLFLGALCDEDNYPVRPVKKRKWSDELFRMDDVRARLRALMQALLPERRLRGSWDLTDHEEIAALTCAATALCVAADRYTAVGSPADGYITLPPEPFMGSGWKKTLMTNLEKCRRRDFPHAEILWC
jgi:hypothetical protein